MAAAPRHLLGPDALKHVESLFTTGFGVIGRHVPGGKTVWGRRFGRFGVEQIARVLSGDGTEAPEILAMRFGERTRYGLLDLDASSPYRTLETYSRVARCASDLGLRVSLCRSSDSGGWHVYLWASEKVATGVMSAALFAVARGAGLEQFRDGVCEVYPDPARPRKAVRLPGQAGFAWLSAETGTPTQEFATTDIGRRLDHLVRWARESSVTPEALMAASASPRRPVPSAKVPLGRPPKLRPVPSPGNDLPDAATLHLQGALVYRYDRNAARLGRPDFATAAAARFAEGARLYASGLERRGTRNESLLLVSFYLFFVGYTGADARERLLTLWMEHRHNGMSAEWSAPESHARIRDEIHRLAHWRPERPGEVGRVRANERRRDEAARKLADAVALLREAGEKVTYRRLIELTGLSSRTIARHQRPKSGVQDNG